MKVVDAKTLIYPDLTWVIPFFIFSLLFTLLSIYIVHTGFPIDVRTDKFNYTFMAIGIIGFLIFAPCTVYCFCRLIVFRPSLIIDENGIYDNASASSAGFVAWAEIESVYIYKQRYRMGSQKILGMKLKDKEEFLMRHRGLKKTLLRMGEYPVNIGEFTINMDIDELYRIIESHITLKAQKRKASL